MIDQQLQLHAPSLSGHSAAGLLFGWAHVFWVAYSGSHIPEQDTTLGAEPYSVNDQVASDPMPIYTSSYLKLIAVGLLTWQTAAAIPILPAHIPNAASACTDALEKFQALADRRARDYDRTQDINPKQLLALLEVAERTDYSLGQLLATGEHESAHTWNNFVRPPLSGGRVGSAAGVWQFQPKTFERVIHLYGEELLELAAADPAAGRPRLDLGFGPFSDAQVRLIIHDTIDGLRDSDDQELRLLRHNVTVLAFAKYLLSKDSGARDPVEDYLFHFLGAKQGRLILSWARGNARHTRSVKPPPPPEEPKAPISVRPMDQPGDNLPGKPKLILTLEPRAYKPLIRGGQTQPITPSNAIRFQPRNTPKTQPPDAQNPPPTPRAPRWPAPHGYPWDSPIVTGNLGMFYRDGTDRGDPYTWAEFLEHLSDRVQAAQQPRLVRAKYGVGFELNGGDMPHWSVDPNHSGTLIRLRLDDGRHIEMPRARLIAPLDAREMRDYQRQLATLISSGEAEPTTILSNAATTTLYRLGLLSGHVTDAQAAALNRADLMAKLGTDMDSGAGIVLHTNHETVRNALNAFRKLVGKAPPQDPAQADLLLPAERIALEMYAARIKRFLAASRPAM